MGFIDGLRGLGREAAPVPVSTATGKGFVCAPVSGRVEPMDALPDPVFASGVVGPCVGIWPTDGIVYAPVSGVVTASMPHAFALEGDDGVQVLIHAGVDTVDMKGDGFTVHVRKGRHVEAGTALLTFERDKVAAAGYPDVVITVVTNADEFSAILITESDEVVAGDCLIVAQE